MLGSGAKAVKPSFVSYISPEEIHIKEPKEKEVNPCLLPDGRNQTVMFGTLEDWRDELEWTKGNVKYKAVTTNEGYRLSEKIYKTIGKPPYELLKMDDLSSSLPSLQDIQTAHARFKQLFLIDNSTDFWATDVKWFSLLESMNWLEIISLRSQKQWEYHLQGCTETKKKKK